MISCRMGSRSYCVWRSWSHSSPRAHLCVTPTTTVNERKSALAVENESNISQQMTFPTCTFFAIQWVICIAKGSICDTRRKSNLDTKQMVKNRLQGCITRHLRDRMHSVYTYVVKCEEKMHFRCSMESWIMISPARSVYALSYQIPLHCGCAPHPLLLCTYWDRRH